MAQKLRLQCKSGPGPVATSKKRFCILMIGLLLALIFYLGAYFLCVSIQFGHNPAVQEQTIQSAGAYYKVSPRLEAVAYRFFEPARLCDAYYFRPKLWEDRQKPVTTKPK
jgi:hypothetical protein